MLLIFYKKTHEERDKAENDINKMILRCSEEIKMNQNNLNNITLEIKELKFRKTHIQLELKDLYFKFLKEKDEK